MRSEEASLRRMIDGLEESVCQAEADCGLGRPAEDPLGIAETSSYALASARRRLALLIDQMKRLEQPDYGVCVRCGDTIPFERLMAAPETELCVKCARRSSGYV